MAIFIQQHEDRIDDPIWGIESLLFTSGEISRPTMYIPLLGSALSIRSGYEVN
jgi:hypothetical protein